MIEFIFLMSTVASAVLLSAAWHNTVWPVICYRMLGKVWKNPRIKALGELDSRQMFTVQCYAQWPFPKFKLGHWLNCHICTAPYIAAVSSAAWLLFTAPILFLPGVMLGAGAILWFHRAGDMSHPVTENTDAPQIKPKVVFTPRPIVPAGDKPKIVLPEKMREFYTAMGITPTVREDGAITPVFNTPQDSARMSKVMEFFHTERPCFFEGCDAMRQEYARAEVAPTDFGCQTCDPKAELQRVFMLRVVQALKQQNL